MNEALTQGFGSIACSDQKRSAAYLAALPAKESICVTQPFQSENEWTLKPFQIKKGREFVWIAPKMVYFLSY